MLDFTVLILRGAWGASVATTLDMLQAAARLAPLANLPQPRWRVLSPSGGLVALSGGLQLASQALPRRARADNSSWIIPGLGVDSPAELTARGERPQ